MGYYIGDDQQIGLAEKLFFADGGCGKLHRKKYKKV